MPISWNGVANNMCVHGIGIKGASPCLPSRDAPPLPSIPILTHQPHIWTHHRLHGRNVEASGLTGH